MCCSPEAVAEWPSLEPTQQLIWQRWLHGWCTCLLVSTPTLLCYASGQATTLPPAPAVTSLHRAVLHARPDGWSLLQVALLAQGINATSITLQSSDAAVPSSTQNCAQGSVSGACIGGLRPSDSHADSHGCSAASTMFCWLPPPYRGTL